MARIAVVFFFVFLVLSLLPSSEERNLQQQQQQREQQPRPQQQLQLQQQQQTQKQQRDTQQLSGYFDPHNHYDGILPWQAYVNLSAYTNNEEITFEQALNLYLWMNDSFFPTEEMIPIYNTDSRMAAGAQATFLIYQNQTEFKETPPILYGALERLLSTTPFTEFDSAYNFRSLILNSDNSSCYTSKYIYDGNTAQVNDDECYATLTDLARTNITYSEQIIVLDNNIWTERNQCVLKCLATNPGIPHKMLLMALGNRLAYTDPLNYQSWDNPSGECLATPWSEVFPTTVNLTAEADAFIGSFNTYLNGSGDCAKALADLDQIDIWDTILGVDHAGPELTCYTEEGMEYFKQISLNLVQEVKYRNSHGKWDGKPLLHHVHVGEGFSIYYVDEIDTKTATFSSVFGQLPGYGPKFNFRTNAEVPTNNVALIVAAIDDLVQGHNDIYGSVVFRLGHVTHIDEQTAGLVADLQNKYPGLIEADINIDSNVITHAYEIVGVDVNEIMQEVLADRETNFEANHLSQYLIPNATDVEQVGLVLGNFTALKFLLTAGVPVLLPIMLGTDGTGTEHSRMDRQHNLATSLITYWSDTDPDFAALDIQMTYFNESSSYHFQIMSTTQPHGFPLVSIILFSVSVGLFIIGMIAAALYWRKKNQTTDFGDDYQVVN